MINQIVAVLLITTMTQFQTYNYASVNEGVAGISEILDNVDSNDIKQALNITYNWTTERVNLREQPDITSDIILTLDKRCKVEVLKKTSSWSKIKYNDLIGWVYSDYLRDTELFTSDKNRWGIELTDKEVDLLAKIVWLESRGESNKGQQAVTEVILNRMYNYEFPDTLYDVLSDHNQFTTWDNRHDAVPTDKEYNNIQKVLNNETDILSFNTVYFGTQPHTDDIETILGNHYFCN